MNDHTALTIIGLKETGRDALVAFMRLLGCEVSLQQDNRISITHANRQPTKNNTILLYCDVWDYIIYQTKQTSKSRDNLKADWKTFLGDNLKNNASAIVSSYAFMQQPINFVSLLNKDFGFNFKLHEIKPLYEAFYKEAFFHDGHTISLIRYCKEDLEANKLIAQLHTQAVLPHDIITPDTKTKIDIVIPCYNLGHLLEDTLASLERSFCDNYTVTIIDDGSTDSETKAGLKKMEGYGYPIIYQQNTGLCKALNHAIETTKNELLLVLSADDKLDPKFITESITIMQQQEDTGVVYCNPKTFEAWYSMWLTPDFDAARFLSLNFIVATSVYRKKYWTAAGGYDSLADGNEDWEMWMNCLEQGAHFHHLDEYLFHYRYRPGSKIQTCNLPNNRKRLVSYMSHKHIHLYQKYIPEIIGNLHYKISEIDVPSAPKNTDQVEVETGAKVLGIMGQFMYRLLRKTGHLTLKRKTTK